MTNHHYKLEMVITTADEARVENNQGEFAEEIESEILFDRRCNETITDMIDADGGWTEGKDEFIMSFKDMVPTHTDPMHHFTQRYYRRPQ